MVTAQDIGVNNMILDALLQLIRNNEIVNSPTCIIRSGMIHIGPPGIGARTIRVKVSECISKTVLQKRCHFIALLIGKPALPAIRTGILGSISRCATFRYPQRIIGFDCSSSSSKAEKSSSQPFGIKTSQFALRIGV
jgi:hypothetical protein